MMIARKKERTIISGQAWATLNRNLTSCLFQQLSTVYEDLIIEKPFELANKKIVKDERIASSVFISYVLMYG